VSVQSMFLTTKINKAPPGTSPARAAAMVREQIAEDFAALGVNSVDMLMLRDSPDCNVIQAQVWSRVGLFGRVLSPTLVSFDTLFAYAVGCSRRGACRRAVPGHRCD